MAGNRENSETLSLAGLAERGRHWLVGYHGAGAGFSTGGLPLLRTSSRSSRSRVSSRVISAARVAGGRAAVRRFQEGLVVRLQKGRQVFLELPQSGDARGGGRLAEPDVRGAGGNRVAGFEAGDFLGQGGGRQAAVGRLPQGLLAGFYQGGQILLELPQGSVARGGGRGFVSFPRRQPPGAV